MQKLLRPKDWMTSGMYFQTRNRQNVNDKDAIEPKFNRASRKNNNSPQRNFKSGTHGKSPNWYQVEWNQISEAQKAYCTRYQYSLASPSTVSALENDNFKMRLENSRFLVWTSWAQITQHSTKQIISSSFVGTCAAT